MSKLIIGNLKMNLLTTVERDRYLESLKKELDDKKLVNCEIIICPPVIHLEAFSDNADNDFSIGAQDIFWQDRGSFTGEISAPMVKNIGAKYVIIGHSERRNIFNETDVVVNAKLKSALSAGLMPILCVGESLEDRANGMTADIITNQISSGLLDVPVSKITSIVIAYEPIWAVGSDVIPSSDEIMGVKILLKKIFSDNFGPAIGEKMRILYGGSVKAQTSRQLCVDSGMDGVLIGRESLIPMELVKIAEIIDKA